MKETIVKKTKYFEGLGRRKRAIARVRVQSDITDISVNNFDYTKYFPTELMREVVMAPFNKLKIIGKFGATVKVNGGGLVSQSEAIKLGMARALVELNPDYRVKLSRLGYLRRDPREKERKKYGLKRARKAPQWGKR
ncbi:30S ribosomal protein S9 [Candidatus Azambacteria bacterium]|nr:30S ribosomal protein S9 [Candidatus Azambacteria bacterium]